MQFRSRSVAVGLILMGTIWSICQSPLRAADSAKPDAALERTRKLVRMLDDIYKSAIVLITKHYVEESSDLPAGEAFKALFSTMREKGWHEVRLLDATGDPIVDENAPQDDFESEAIRQLKGGKPYYEQVVERDGQEYLRAATAIPVVMDKCTMCHENYKKVKKGEAIGALGYLIKIE
jgi:hypothetical protein